MKRKFVYNKTEIKYVRQKLRRNSTVSEKILWYKIRDSKLGYKFFRQYSVEGCVLDFYCPKKRLAIEIDGGYHQNPIRKSYDLYRTELINTYGIKVIRFTNSDIELTLGKVLSDIAEKIVSLP